jgi:hypothetical protein
MYGVVPSRFFEHIDFEDIFREMNLFWSVLVCLPLQPVPHEE